VTHESITFPYMNVLVYADQTTFGVEFYDDTDDPGYAERFASGWRQLTRETPLRPRAHPFFFVVCQRCSTPVLTNRRPHAVFACRVCGGDLEAVEMPSSRLAELRDATLERIGRRVVDISGLLQAVVVQLVEPEATEAVEAACADAGFDRASDESPIHALLASEGLRRGFDASGDLTTWQKVADDGQLALEGETTPEVEDLVGRLNEIAGVRTGSSTFDLGGDDDLTLFLRSDLDELERRAREGLARDPTSASWLAALVEILFARGAFEEATEKALTLTVARDDAASWQLLGRVQLRAGHPAEAAEAYERVLELDPLARTAMTFLAHCYAELGDDTRAQLMHARSLALGGPY
jgi:tetratricopeptide (TPR) repeat protein